MEGECRLEAPVTLTLRWTTYDSSIEGMFAATFHIQIRVTSNDPQNVRILNEGKMEEED